MMIDMVLGVPALIRSVSPSGLSLAQAVAAGVVGGERRRLVRRTRSEASGVGHDGRAPPPGVVAEKVLALTGAGATPPTAAPPGRPAARTKPTPRRARARGDPDPAAA